MTDSWLDATVDAHIDGYVYGEPFAVAERELRRGRKETDWMWYVFPQWVGLGSSAESRRFGVASLEAAEAFLRHDLLRGNYRSVVAAVRKHLETGARLDEMFGHLDALKCVSSLTLASEVNEQLSIADDLGDDLEAVLGLVERQGFMRCHQTLRWLSEG